MKVRWAALLFVLALGVLAPGTVTAQANPVTPPAAPAPPPPPRSPGFELGQNSPNPFSQSTVIPFTLGDPPGCTDGGREYTVTLRIFNVLAQMMAIPVLQTGEFANGNAVVGLGLRCGNYIAFWNGYYLNTTQPVPPGVYLYRIEVDGRATARKMVIVR
jgi:hypothetical protein